MTQKNSGGSWKQLAEQKEKEWREVLESRIECLESEASGKEKELFNERSKFHELKEHFKYNLKLLEERDRELEKYDITFQDVKSKLNAKTAEISELKIRLDDLKAVIGREEKAKDELQGNYQRRLREKQAEVDAYKSSKDNEVQGERQDYEKFRRDLHRQLASVQGELETQKRELTTEFETAVKKREHDFKLHKDELEAKVFEFDLKVKLLEKELELTRESNEKTQNLAEETESAQRDLEKQLKQKDWELADMTAVKDSQIAELKSQLCASETATKKMHEDFQRKYTELDRSVREREDTLERARAGYLEKEQNLQSTIQKLQSRLEDWQVKERQMLWSHQDVIKEKDVAIEKLEEEVKDTKERWDRHVAEISRSTVERDTEFGTAKEEIERLRGELRLRKIDIERYQKELKAGAEREEQLDRSKLQTELDFQRRTEQLETRQYNQSEELIGKLTTARDQAQALVRERERELRHKVLLVKSLHRERDQLRGLLKDHDIPLDGFVKYSMNDKEEGEEMNYMENLQQQNSELKQLIGQMKVEMEALSLIDMNTTNNNNDAIPKENPSTYEKVIAELKRENKQLQAKLSSRQTEEDDERALKHFSIDPSKEREVMDEVEGNSIVKSHIMALNGTIGSLRSEKVELAATAKKQQVRIAFLENSLEEVSKQPRQKQAKIDQLTYELSTSKQRAETEMEGLKRRTSELELMLGETRREADEYHREGVERNMELVALGNQLAALKMEQSSSGATVNFGAQELYIQQLQSELTQLRKRATALDPSSDASQILAGFSSGSDTPHPGEEGRGRAGSSSGLQYKLRSAAAKIIQLAKENQQLTESNNRLRAELNVALASQKPERNNALHPEKLGEKPFSHAIVQNAEDINNQDESGEELKGRLSQLENLQYQLTRQELQFANRFKDNSDGNTCETNLESSGNDLMSQTEKTDVRGIKSSNPWSGAQPTKSFESPQPAAHQHGQFESPQPASQQHRQEKQQNRRNVNPNMLMSMSSGGGESIQQVWQMLDESLTSYGPSEFAAMSPRSAQAASRVVGDEGDFILKGQTHDSAANNKPQSHHGRNKSSSRQAAINYARTHVPKPSQQAKAKVRNYNIRDER